MDNNIEINELNNSSNNIIENTSNIIYLTNEIEKRDLQLKHIVSVLNNYKINHLETKNEVNKLKDDDYILNKLLKEFNNRLNGSLDIQKKNIIIARSSYHNINNKYWLCSIFILVFSSFITFIEATKLIIENNEKQKIKSLTYIINLLSLFLGILITIITGYIKFNDYQNKLEIISNRLTLLLQYNKKFEIIKFNLSSYYSPDEYKDKKIGNKSKRLDFNILEKYIVEFNNLEIELQNNELLKYITERDELMYYKKYVKTYVKDVLYDDYLKTINKFKNEKSKKGYDNIHSNLENIILNHSINHDISFLNNGDKFLNNIQKKINKNV
tara:strand:- start:714 stop:1694 length:981 start_codon:yes stop_codon:yes gene_type:complete